MQTASLYHGSPVLESCADTETGPRPGSSGGSSEALEKPPAPSTQSLSLDHWWDALEFFPGVSFSEEFPGTTDAAGRLLTCTPFAVHIGVPPRNPSEESQISKVLCLLLENPLEDFYLAFPVAPDVVPEFEGNRWLTTQPLARAWLLRLLGKQELLRLIETSDMSQLDYLLMSWTEIQGYAATTVPEPEKIDKATLVHSLPDEILELESQLLPEFFTLPAELGSIQEEASPETVLQEYLGASAEDIRSFIRSKISEPLQTFLD